MTQKPSPSDFFITHHQSDVPIRRTKRTPPDFVTVDQWEGLSQPVMTRSDGGSTRYAGQLIIQLEDKPGVLKYAVRLAEKHPGSVLVQLDKKNHYRVLSVSPKTLQGKLRWQLVGHSNPSPEKTSPYIRTMSGMTPADLADLLKVFKQRFNKEYSINSTPNRISLVSCRLIDHLPENFATQFAHAMKQQGIQAEISARVSLVSVPLHGHGKKFTRKMTSVNQAQTAGETLLLGWNQKRELIHKKHSSAFRLLYPVLKDWAPNNFTDPKIKSQKFKYLVYPSSIKNLIHRKDIFSKNIQDKIRKWDLMSASILSDETLRGYTVGVILEVPEQNILAAAPDESIFEPNVDGFVKKSGADFPSIKTNIFQKLNEISHPKNTIEINGLLSNQLFHYRQRISGPDDIIKKTSGRNTVLVTGRPYINIYPDYPVTKDIKITGLFLIYSDPPKNTGEAPSFSSSEPVSLKDLGVLREAARDITQELGIELKVIKIHRDTDDAQGHHKNIPPKINQKTSISPSEMTHGQKNLGSSLTENLKRVWTLVNDLCSNKWTSFSPSDLKILTDFFHLPSGGLDWQKLYQVLSDRMFYSQFTTQIQSLMQLSDTHGQFMNLTGQEALNRIAQWDNFVVENMVRWNERIKLYNKIPGFGPQIHPGIQAMYIDDGSDLAQRKARKVSLAYLSLLRLDDKALRVKLLDAFQSHAEINEQKIFSQGDAQDPKNFGPLIDQLEENSAFIAKGLQSLDQFFNTLDNEKAGYYQLRMGEHILAIAKRQGEDEKIHWYVYDANFGEISMTSDKFQNTSDPLRLMLQDYFTHLKNVRQENGTGVFDVYQFNSDHMFKTSSFKQLKEFISNTDGLLHTLSTHKFFKTHKNRGNTQQVGKLSRTVDMLGKAHQGLSWIRSLTFLSHYWRRRYSDQLMESQKQALDFEAQLAMAGLMYDVGSTFLELGFSKLGFQLIQKFSSQSVGVFASRIQRLQFKAGLKLARYGGPFLNILGAGFDIYQAQKTATELKTATEPDIQQDLKVSIALSSLGAFISLTSGLTFLALSGKMALMGGMMGIALGMLTAVVGGIYFSVREVQQIERYATLTGSQKLRTGWLKFLGSEIDTEVANQVTKGQAEKQAKENIHQQFKTHFQALLDSDNEIEAVYYTTGPIILSGCPYKKLTGRKRADLALTVSKLNRNIFTKYIKDKILPSQAGAILLDHRRKKEGQFSLYVDLTLENSEYKFYDFEGLSATHDKISLDTDVLSEGILSVKRQSQLSSTSSPSVPPIKADPPDSTKPAKIYFFLGAGNDEVVGYKEKRNIFDIGDGTKNFKGGGQSDTFIFRGNTPPPKPSVLDGVRGSNLLIANKKPSQGGYRVDLQAGYFSFTEGDDSKKIATLKNIHHIETCPETDDVIWGNDQTNILNGKGGEDKLIGFDGNDILVAQAGKMEGGKGTDCYRVLQNTHGEPATLIIKEEDDPEEFSHVFLDYSVEQIISIRRLKQNVLIELRNNNDSITTLTLSYLYFLSVERPQRRLTTQYIFYTQEGVIFSGLPSEIAFNFNEEEPEPLTLIAQYAQKFDQKFTPPEYESEKYPLIIQKMAYQKNRGGYRYQGRKKNIAGFFEISSARNGF